MKQLFVLIIICALTQSLFGQNSKVDKFISAYTKKHNFSGTILVQQDSKDIYNGSFGLANRQFKVPNQNDTKYKIASITKAFTSVLILQLYEQGKIDLNKTIKAYLPAYTGEGGDKVTIHQLLNHTSGITNMDTTSSQESAIKKGIPQYQAPYTTDELLAEYCSGRLVNESGKVFSYNNAEYIILGKIIEKIYNQPYEQVLEQQVLHPLNMNSTGLLYQYNIMEKLADTYFVRNDLNKLVNDLPVYIENWYAAGAIYSTASDLMKFSNALFSFKLLKRETLNLMLKPGLDDYGYGVWIRYYDINGKKYKAMHRPGSIMGATTELFHVIDPNLTIIILANTNTTDTDGFALDISRQLLK